MHLKLLIVLAAFAFVGNITIAQNTPSFRSAKAPMEARVNDLLHALTLQEKISMLGNNSPSVNRLNIPAYNWWNESLHGIARAGEATVFPQAIGMAATFNDTLLQMVASAISTEARAKYNLAAKMNRHLWYMGLTFWSPNINIFRDPRWGRGQETYGEDPFLTSKMGTAYVKGLQGNNPDYLKVSACAKHFAVHSGPEATRHTANVVVDEKDVRETYLYSFKKLVDAGVESVMCAYNRVNGEPCCTGKTLLQEILKNEWHFKGHIVTDCGALDDILVRHKVINTKEELAAAALKAGINLECGGVLQEDVLAAINKGLLKEANVDSAVSGILRTQMKLGMYDNDSSLNPYNSYGADSVHNAYHTELSRRAAQQSLVLLKNNGVLPLQKDKYSSILVTGANSASLEAMVGNYHGMSGNIVTFAEGITKAAGPATVVQYDQGSDYTDTVHFGGIWASQNSDLTIAVVGLTPLLEGEEGDAFLSASGGDKATLSLPQAHIAFLKKLRAAHKKPIVAVVTAGSAVDIAAIEPYADAVILAWYPGEQGGNALADILFGNVSPSGRLPVTFYQSLSDLPDYTSYNMKGRTYRYFNGKVEYPFGYGLSYTTFAYKWQQEPRNNYSLKDTIRFTTTIQNTGQYNGDEVVQVYVEYPNLERMPLKELKAFKRVSVAKGNTKNVVLNIPVTELQKWDLAENKWKLYKGTYSICVGRNSSDYILKKSFSVK
ncbi:glycoside hydrolase family 3 N-terminal domain-containing protein [Segetibacter koreensis]|uniref:glycoside hydrolase family 3 N-terminal domain-containing protein n=1 Tax=Segetibacter koreensis TaxID=398037 RepID=UPI00037A5925|nr:glycoside hydrolase family 3 N-terminal domain-containing protein [Segetibacter koreensis]